MSKAEKFIEDYTRRYSNAIAQPGEDMWDSGGFEVVYQPWLTQEDALSAVEIARDEVMEKTMKWIEEINNHHHIMRYSDSEEASLEELKNWFRNYMEKGEQL